MNQKDIEGLLTKYREGRCTPEETAAIHMWYENLHADSRLALDENEQATTEQRILDHIQKNIHEHPATRARRLHWWQTGTAYTAAAAAVIVIMCWSLLGGDQPGNSLHKEKVLVEAHAGKMLTKTNQSGKPQKLTMEDGSYVTLAPGSEIIYPAHFDSKKREVQLFGDAFFEIAKNPDKPFLVYTGKLITRVLGTSFRIKTNPADQAMEVEVVTGKVSVSENAKAFRETATVDPSKGVVLTPNQRVTYFPESRHLTTGLVMQPVQTKKPEIEDARMVFNDIPLDKIVNVLHASYGIEIVFANDRLAHCTFTGDITGLPLYEKLDLLCGSVGADYEIKGTRILINGQGCE